MLDTIKRGDIYYIEWKGEVTGCEQHPGRPAIVVSSDRLNTTGGTIEIVYLTTQPKKDMPTHVSIFSTGRESTALCEQISSVSKDRLQSYVGTCTKKEMARVDVALMVSVNVGEIDFELLHEGKDSKQNAEEVSKLTAERDAYKAMYDQLLERVLQMPKTA